MRYYGADVHLATLINSFWAAYTKLTRVARANGNRRVVTIVIPRVEGQLLSIIRYIAEPVVPNGFNSDWLAAHRKEINECFTEFRTIRQVLPREAELEADIKRTTDLFSNFENLYDIEQLKRTTETAASHLYYTRTMLAATGTTSTSAISFIGGPIVGGAVTATVGVLSFSAAAIAANHLVKKTVSQVAPAAEASLRADFNLP